MALQMVRSFFGQGTPSRSRVHEPVIGIESLGNQEGNSSYDRGDVGKSAASNWFELARHPTSELGRKPHTTAATSYILTSYTVLVITVQRGSLSACVRACVYSVIVDQCTFVVHQPGHTTADISAPAAELMQSYS